MISKCCLNALILQGERAALRAAIERRDCHCVNRVILRVCLSVFSVFNYEVSVLERTQFESNIDRISINSPISLISIIIHTHTFTLDPDNVHHSDHG